MSPFPLILIYGGDFSVVNSYADASAQIREAAIFILDKTGGMSVPLFAFPYGRYNDYLIEEYFPNYMDEHGMIAAFSADGKYVSAQDNRWCLSRFICGFHWKSPADLIAILNG